MSKNFELLRQAGWDQDFFPDLPTDEQPPEPREHRTIRPRLGNDQISKLVQRIFLDPRSSHIRSVVFTATSRRVGCTQTCIQTARALADSAEGTVCAVDANFSAPALSKHFSAEMQEGLSESMARANPIGNFAKQVNESGLWIVSAGRPPGKASSTSTAALLHARLRELKTGFDYVLVDAPPIHPTWLPSGSAFDGAVLVVTSGAVGPKDVVEARKQLDRARVPLLGVVLNQRASALPSILDRLMR